MDLFNLMAAQEVNGNCAQPENDNVSGQPVTHIIEVEALPDVGEWVKPRLDALICQLTDEELAYAIVYMNEELKKSQGIESTEETDDYYVDEDFDDDNNDVMGD